MRPSWPVSASVLLGLLLSGCATSRQTSLTPEEAEFAGVLLDSLHRRIDAMEQQESRFYAAVAKQPQHYWNDNINRDFRFVSINTPFASASGISSGADIVSALQVSEAVAPMKPVLKRMGEAWKVVWMGEGERALLAGYLLGDGRGSTWFVWTEGFVRQTSLGPKLLLEKTFYSGGRMCPRDWSFERFSRFTDFIMGHCIAIDASHLDSLSDLRALED